LVNEHSAILFDSENDLRIFRHFNSVKSGREFNIKAFLNERSCYHEDNEKNKENIAKGDHIRFGDDFSTTITANFV
jgi:hypothetical protein